jgi:hypothetical protein
VISGTAQEGQTLKATAAVANDADAVVTYQWQESFNGGASWTSINGATSLSYVVQESDEGAILEIVATSTDADGAGESATSGATATVKEILPKLSVTVSGTAQDGQTLKATAKANDADAVISYQWQILNGTTWSNIVGATGQSLLVTEADEGQKLRVVAKSTDADSGHTTAAASSATKLVTDAPPSLTIGSHALTVKAGGSIGMGISVLSPDSDDTVSVTIKGLTSYETITDGADSTVFSGSSVVLTAAEVNGGLTLHSTYNGALHPKNTLTITAANTTPGETVSSKSQTISVTDPAIGSMSPQLALLTQFMASFTSATAGLDSGWSPQTESRPKLTVSLPSH